jgi:hypothetical protein
MPAPFIERTPTSRLQALRRGRWSVLMDMTVGPRTVRGLVSQHDHRAWCVGVYGAAGTERRLWGAFGLPGHVPTLAELDRWLDFVPPGTFPPAERVPTLARMVPIALGPRLGDGLRNVARAA